VTRSYSCNKAIGSSIVTRAESSPATTGIEKKSTPANGAQPNAVMEQTKKYGEEYLPLHLACSNGKGASVRALLEIGADPNLRDEGGMTPLHYSIKDQNQNLNVVEILLSHGADSNLAIALPTIAGGQRPNNGWEETGATPLIGAVRARFTKAVELLLQHGAKVDDRDGLRRTAFWYAGGKLSAAETKKLSPNLLRIRHLLLRAGANPNPMDRRGRTPQQEAAHKQALDEQPTPTPGQWQKRLQREHEEETGKL
jgi:ankyrin repeat protein